MFYFSVFMVSFTEGWLLTVHPQYCRDGHVLLDQLTTSLGLIYNQHLHFTQLIQVIQDIQLIEIIQDRWSPAANGEHTQLLLCFSVSQPQQLWGEDGKGCVHISEKLMTCLLLLSRKETCLPHVPLLLSPAHAGLSQPCGPFCQPLLSETYSRTLNHLPMGLRVQMLTLEPKKSHVRARRASRQCADWSLWRYGRDMCSCGLTHTHPHTQRHTHKDKVRSF